MQAVKDAIARAKGPEADGAAGYERLTTEARNLFQTLSAEEQQNLLGNLPPEDRVIIGAGRRKGRTSKKSRRRRSTRRRR